MRARLLPTASVLLAGLAQAASIALPGSGQPLWWLQILSLSVLVWQLNGCAGHLASWSSSTWSDAERRPPWQTGWRGAAWLGWVFATAWLSGSFWWLFISMHTYGGLPAVLAVLAVLALAGALSLYYAAACAVFFKLFSGFPSVRWTWAAICFASAWTLAELARGRWFTGFPWGAGGYAHTAGPLANYAPWLGVYGVGAVAAWAAFMLPGLVSISQGRLRRAAALVAVALILPLGARWAMPSFTHSSGALDVALLQGNIPQDEKFQPGTGVADALRWYGGALRDSRALLTVAPETALPLLPRQLPPGYRYDKTHLVPFGEFIPTGFRWFTALMNIPLGDFNRGPLNPPSFLVRGARVAPNICYEDLFGEELARRFADAASAPTVLANISNIGWFGDSIAIPQHLNISRLRSLELQRPMLRATNTGATAVIDHRGVVQAALPPFTVGVLSATVQGREGLTPFARWAAAAGLWPLWALAALGLAWPVRPRGGQGAAAKLGD
jgi:apolipoprotein N-acyltransferase